MLLNQLSLILVEAMLIGHLNELLRLLLLRGNYVSILVDILDDLRLCLLPGQSLNHGLMCLFSQFLLLLLLWLLNDDHLATIILSQLRLLLLLIANNDLLLW
jgi:hypothetical protein